MRTITSQTSVFVADLQAVGERIQQAQESYNEARRNSTKVAATSFVRPDAQAVGCHAQQSEWVESVMEEPVPRLTNKFDQHQSMTNIRKAIGYQVSYCLD